MVICGQCRKLPISSDFWYSLLFGLLPTAVDVSTDLRLGKIFEQQEDVTSAAACWLLVCLPTVYCCMQHVAKKYNSIGVHIIVVIFVAGILLCAVVSVIWFPRLLFYPAVLSGLTLLIVKILATFHPSPGIKQLSSQLSRAESSIEASGQLLLLIFMWLTQGEMYLPVMISSIVVIGKVAAENYLRDGPEDLLEDKSFKEKISLVLRFLPLFLLTAFFRSGSFVVFLLDYDWTGLDWTIFSTTMAFLNTFYYCWIYLLFFMIVFSVLRWMMPELRELTMMEMTSSLLDEATTISTWGSLGRRRARRLQMAMNSFFFLSR